MNKRLYVAIATMFATSAVFAADLNNTQWRTIDDTTGKAKAQVEFKQQANGTYTATIKKLLDPNVASKTCIECSGALKNKPLEGLTIVQNLKATSDGKYDGGTILDPKTGKTYKMKSEISADGKKMTVRGYMGISALGRNQTWQRVQ